MIQSSKTSDRETAEALSEGFNCIAAIVATLRDSGTPVPSQLVPQWVAALEAMEKALNSIESSEVKTSLAVPHEQRESVRRLHARLKAWESERTPPHELHETAKTVSVFFKLAPTTPPPSPHDS